MMNRQARLDQLKRDSLIAILRCEIETKTVEILELDPDMRNDLRDMVAESFFSGCQVYAQIINGRGAFADLTTPHIDSEGDE